MQRNSYSSSNSSLWNKKMMQQFSGISSGQLNIQGLKNLHLKFSIATIICNRIFVPVTFVRIQINGRRSLNLSSNLLFYVFAFSDSIYYNIARTQVFEIQIFQISNSQRNFCRFITPSTYIIKHNNLSKVIKCINACF